MSDIHGILDSHGGYLLGMIDGSMADGFGSRRWSNKNGKPGGPIRGGNTLVKYLLDHR